MQTFIKWLVLSSANSSKWSLTLKGVLGTAVTVITMVAGLGHVQVGDLTPLVDSIIQAVQAVALAVTSIAGVVGLFRKIYRTVKGTHDAIHNED